MTKSTVSSQDYKQLAERLYQLIITEMEEATDLSVVYPKAIVMYEFFRFIRGEAFHTGHEPTTGYQNQLYEMENTIGSKLKEMKSKLDFSGTRLRYNLDQYGKEFGNATSPNERPELSFFQKVRQLFFS